MQLCSSPLTTIKLTYMQETTANINVLYTVGSISFAKISAITSYFNINLKRNILKNRFGGGFVINSSSSTKDQYRTQNKHQYGDKVTKNLYPRSDCSK